jgi:MOSC domain-containing protein YiiM
LLWTRQGGEYGTRIFNKVMPASIASVNVGSRKMVTHHGRTFETGIYKYPVGHPVAVRGVNLEGDDQADRVNHGGVDRAIYAYALEDYAWWSAQLQRQLEPGEFGENLTLRGIDANAALVGERWRIGAEVELEVSIPRVPCFKLAAKMDDPRFAKQFAAALRPGPYLRIWREGTLQAGDSIVVTHRPNHGIRIADVARIYLFDRDELPTLLRAPELGENWLSWIREKISLDASPKREVPAE